MNNLNDIIYPECHLDSPIVSGKLIEYVLYAELPCNQTLDDMTLFEVISYNKRNSLRSSLITTQLELRDEIESRGINTKRLNHIPYPYGNQELFTLSDQDLSRKLYNLFRIAHSGYSKISHRLVALKRLVERQLSIRTQDQTPDLIDQHNEHSMVNLHLKFEGSKWFKPFLFWFTLKTDYRDIVRTSSNASKRSKSRPTFYELRRYFIFINRNLVVIIEKATFKTHYLTNEILLMICDVVEGRLMIDVGMTSDYRYKDFQPRGYALWNLIDNLFCDLGNQTYNIVAMIEPLTLGFLQLNDKSPDLKGAFLKYALDELRQEFIDNNYGNPEQLDTIEDIIYKIFDIPDIHMIAEFFSFFRTFGHPTLEASEAAKKVREHMNKPKVVNFKTMMKGHALFCAFIINGFRERHGGSWPPLTLPNHASNSITSAYHNKKVLLMIWSLESGNHLWGLNSNALCLYLLMKISLCL